MVFGDEGSSLVCSVYWSLKECDSDDDENTFKTFVSLSGRLLKLAETSIIVHESFLEENSSKNLVKLFTADSISSATLSTDDPLKSLIESLMKLAQVNLDKAREAGDGDGKEVEVYFQGSVVIGGKREHALYILKTQNIDCGELFRKLKECKSLEDKSHLIKAFYLDHSQYDPKCLEEAIFCSDIYESLLEEDVDDLEKMIESLKTEGLELNDLSTDLKDLSLNFQELDTTFQKMLQSKLPSEKLSILAEFHAQLTKNKSDINADALLPLLTHVVMNLKGGHCISKEIKFIERFTHPSFLTGYNNYILTSTVTI